MVNLIPAGSPQPSNEWRGYGDLLDLHVVPDGSVEIFYQTAVLLALAPEGLTELADIERTGVGRYLSMDLKLLIPPNPMNYHPDIFTLLLT
ncbi:MAG: hypothetical protein V3T60_13305 [Candidatus Binatia bacterium]